MRYRNKRISVSAHAVARFRERTGAYHLAADEVRRLIASVVLPALEKQQTCPHHVPGQTQVLLPPLVEGAPECYAVVAADRTGWSKTGLAVVSVLSREQAMKPAHEPVGGRRQDREAKTSLGLQLRAWMVNGRSN